MEHVSYISAPGLLATYKFTKATPSPEFIMITTCAKLEVNMTEMLSPSRLRRLVEARMIAMFFMRELTSMSLKAIGDLFDRDHTSVIHCIQSLRNLMQTDPEFEKKVQAVRRML